ncbi:MAG: Uncharacterised protein [Glaciecola sp. HTCC2999]|jgi:GNAT superfamily N-acetyltransferase|nr:MAG: Uncharacterised protein [Glaciecola sp. HTCC2999]
MLTFVSFSEATSTQQSTFTTFNKAWVEQYFVLEEKDVYTLEHPQASIIDKGGEVLIGLDKTSTSVITCAMLNAGNDIYELSKMGMDQAHKGKGYAEQIVNAAIDWANTQGAQTIFLESNRILTNALYVYEKCGFVEVPMLPSPYARADIRMELQLR